MAISLAQHFKTVVVSADSRQFYREIPIGTAQVSPEEQQGIPHFFMGDRSLRNELNAGSFADEARAKIHELFRQYGMLIVCGGSGLYLKALLYGMDPLPDSDPELRQKLNAAWQAGGKEQILNQLRELDPDFLSIADINNPQRIIRALEVSTISGKPYSSLLSQTKPASPFAYRHYCLMPERSALYENIRIRTEKMMALGFESEARNVYALRDLNVLKTVGYKELFQYFDGDFTLNRAKELIVQHTRNYAKRQVTWFRNQMPATFVNPEDSASILSDLKRD